MTPPLAEWIAAQRWFAAKSRRIVAIRVEDRIAVGGATVNVVRIGLDDGSVHTYVVPLREATTPSDAFEDPGFCRALLDLIGTSGRVEGDHGALVGRASTGFPRDLPADLPARRVSGEQSNTSVTFGESLIVKHFRRVVAGVNPELEICRHLINEQCTTTELAWRTGMTQPQVSRHLRRLREAGLVVSARHGRTVQHRLQTSRLYGIGYDLVAGIVG